MNEDTEVVNRDQAVTDQTNTLDIPIEFKREVTPAVAVKEVKQDKTEGQKALDQKYVESLR